MKHHHQSFLSATKGEGTLKRSALVWYLTIYQFLYYLNSLCWNGWRHFVKEISRIIPANTSFKHTLPTSNNFYSLALSERPSKLLVLFYTQSTSALPVSVLGLYYQLNVYLLIPRNQFWQGSQTFILIENVMSLFFSSN